MSSSREIQPYSFTPIPDRFGVRSGLQPGSNTLQDLEAMAEAARTEGYQDGYQAGLGRAAEQQRAAVEQLGLISKTARVETDRLIRGLEEQVVELALAVANKVIEREPSADPSIVVDVVRSALDEIQGATMVYVRINPQDRELVEPHWQAMLHGPIVEHSRLVVDEQVEPGGCVIETQVGQIDAQISTKFLQVANMFGAVLDGEPA